MREHFFHAVLKTVPAASPGAATIVMSWAGVIQNSLSILFLLLSIAFLIWRWRVAMRKNQDG